MSFKGRNDNTNSLFKKLEIMKFKDILRYNNVIFAYDQINTKLPEIFKDFFVKQKTSIITTQEVPQTKLS